MVWKKKEKELTPEEAISLAKSHLASRWVGLSPLVAVIEEEGRLALYPLEKSFKQENWVFILLDPLEPESHRVFSLLAQWQERYGSFGIKFLLVFTSPLAALFDERQALLILQSAGLRATATLDVEHQFSHLFGWRSGLSIVLMSHGKRRDLYTPGESLSAVEIRIQALLRDSDPGLPLFSVLQIEPLDQSKIERISLKEGATSPIKIEWKGNWSAHPHGRATRDPQAEICIHAKGGSLELIAKVERDDVALESQIKVDAAGVPVLDAFAGRDIKSDNDGSTVASIQKLRSYNILQNLPPNRSPVTLRMAQSDLVPVVLVGIRWMERS
jgi:hypothetical protein